MPSSADPTSRRGRGSRPGGAPSQSGLLPSRRSGTASRGCGPRTAGRRRAPRGCRRSATAARRRPRRPPPAGSARVSSPSTAVAQRARRAVLDHGHDLGAHDGVGGVARPSSTRSSPGCRRSRRARRAPGRRGPRSFVPVVGLGAALVGRRSVRSRCRRSRSRRGCRRRTACDADPPQRQSGDHRWSSVVGVPGQRLASRSRRRAGGCTGTPPTTM